MTKIQNPQVQARRAAVSSFAGAVIEWYDFLLYGLVAATVFNTQFFPDVSPAIGVLAAFATFGVGFLFRPLGGLVFGHYGDRIGRKRTLVITMTIMGFATAGIGMIPNFETIGWLAPLALVLLRAVQGFAVGGEWGGAALMAVESAPKGKKALYSSGVQIGFSVGLMLATAFVTIMGNVAGDDFVEWGWRVPFISSIVLVGVGLIIRSKVVETFEAPAEEVRAEGKHKLPIVNAIKENPKAFFQIIGLRLIELFTMYIVTTFALSYSVNTLGMDNSFMLNIGLIVGAIGMISIPTFAYLSDRFGRRKIYLAASVIGVLSSVPFFIFLEAGSLVGVIVFSILLVNVAHDMAVSVQQPLITQMFGAEHRNSGAGVGYQVASAIAGGFTPFIAAALVGFGGGSWYLVAAYLAAGCLISGLVAYFMKSSGMEDAPDMADERSALSIPEDASELAGRVSQS
jgi:MFS transporter, MHS family, shikimate and dehydroshikimate transport protein